MACYQLRKKVQDIFFFKQSKLKLGESDESLVETFFHVNTVYQELKRQLT